MENNIETNVNMEFNENEKNNLIQDFLEVITKKLQQKKQLDNQSREQPKEEIQEEIQENLQQENQQEKTLVIDRFEGNFAVCENRETLEMENIEISKLPLNIKQGDVIKSKNNQFELDEQSKSEIEERIKNKMKNLFND